MPPKNNNDEKIRRFKALLFAKTRKLSTKINESLKTAENGLKSNSINIYADLKIKNKKIITYDNATNHHKHQNRKNKKIKCRKNSEKNLWKGSQLTVPPSEGGVPPFAALAYLRPFKGIFAAKARIYHDNNANG